MQQEPWEEDSWYKARRVWTYSKHSWEGAWYHKLGWPYGASDEWGRRTIVWGVGFLGYVCFAYRTCWCQACHVARQQTYKLEVEQWRERQERLARGQCTCENLMVYRTRDEGGKVLGPCAGCAHPLEGHDKWGDCTHVDVSMRPIKEGLPEILEIGGSGDVDVRGDAGAEASD